MNGPTSHQYCVRFPLRADAEPPVDVQVHALVDLAAQTVTIELPDRTRTTVDVVTARALQMVLHAAVYSSLRPVGPFLRLEQNTGDSWPAAQDAQAQQ